MTSYSFQSRSLKFIEPGGTSRGVLFEKPSWIVKASRGDQIGIGEISLIPGLNPENQDQVQALIDSCPDWDNLDLTELPSVRFGLEMAKQSLNSASPFDLFPSDFVNGKTGIQINGLIWMGEKEEMIRRVKEKLEAGFRCLKLKVGAIDFQDELAILQHLRSHFDPRDLEIRLDANGAFTGKGESRLRDLAKYQIHSIEQPVKAREWDEMRFLCSQDIIPVALDEELIGITHEQYKLELVQHLQPHFLIFKPSLLGGFAATEEWISVCERTNTPWWATSALESNIGLNAIAQWVFTKNNPLPQGLGTGKVFSNNFECPLFLRNDELHYNPTGSWTIPGQ